MTKNVCQMIGEETLYYVHLTGPEEAKELGLPEYTTFFWEYKGTRIFSPAAIIQIVQDAASSGKWNPVNVASEAMRKGYFEEVLANQRNALLDALDEQIKTFSKMGALEVVKNLQQTRAEVMKETANMTSPAVEV